MPVGKVLVLVSFGLLRLQGEGAAEGRVPRARGGRGRCGGTRWQWGLVLLQQLQDTWWLLWLCR